MHLLADLLLWIDEAHHVKNIAMEDIEGEVISNGIGELVKHLLDVPKNSVQLGLTTASFFRGDRCSLLTPLMEERFERFNLPYDEYLASMEHLKSFSFDFLLCGHEYTKAIGALMKTRKGKDIIYVPHPKSRHSTGNKYGEVQDIFSEYQKAFGGELVDLPTGLTILRGPDSDFKMLDLVDEDRRNEKKEFLNSDELKNQRETLDSIIALGMFKEGANWIWADRSIIVGARASLVDVVQMMGRLFRDAKGKKHVEVIQLLPFSLDQQSDNFRDNLNNYLKAVYASLILEDILKPVTILAPPSTRPTPEKDSTEAGANDKPATPMSDLIPDESIRLSVLEDVIHRLASISENNRKEGKGGIPALYEEYQSALPEILQDYGITDRIEDIGDKIWSMLLRRSASLMQGADIENIDFEIVRHTHPLQGLLRYTSSACGIDTLDQLRKAIRSWEEEKKVRWEFYYGLLLKYTEEYGNCRVHKDYETVVDGKIIKLGSWYSDQKKHFASLPLSKQERLRKLPGFVAKKFKRNQALSIEAWTDLYISASKRLGTPLIPPRYVGEGYNIGAWLQHIRKEEEWKKLSPEQKQRLLDNNFKLSPTEEWGEAAVLAMFQFAGREGTTVPMYGHKENVFHKGLEYSIRLDNLRNRIKKAPAEVEPAILEGVQKIPKFLEELQDNEEDDATYLQRGLKYYEKFKQRTDLVIIPKGHMEGDFDLSRWDKSVSTRKSLSEKFKEEVLKVDPYYFAEHSTRVFMQDVQPRIAAFMRENGHALIPQGYVCADGYLLGQRVSDLRGSKGKLPLPIADYLSSLGSKWAWNYFEYLHTQNAEKLRYYLEKNGYESKTWPKEIRQLRSKLKKDFQKYPETQQIKDTIERLAPGIFAEPKDENLVALLAFVQREGHACPRIKHFENGVPIGRYVSRVRVKNKNGLLSEKERAKYESLNGWRWDASDLKSATIRETAGRHETREENL